MAGIHRHSRTGYGIGVSGASGAKETALPFRRQPHTPASGANEVRPAGVGLGSLCIRSGFGWES